MTIFRAPAKPILSLVSSEGFQLAKELMGGENYDPSANGGAKTGSYGFLFEDNMGVCGAAYDFPYEGHNTLMGRVQRGYSEWLDGIVESTDAEPNDALRDATVGWLNHLVYFRPIDKGLGIEST
jgi:hypothetical protein